MEEGDKIQFDKTFELRKFEIENFWKRSWFFGALLIALSAVYFSLKPDTQIQYSLYVSFITLLVCIAQCLMNRGSKYWQERWEYFEKEKEKILKIEVTAHQKTNVKAFLEELDRKSENIFTRAWRISVSKMTFLVWDLIAFFWLAIWFSDTKVLDALLKSNYQLRVPALIFHLLIVGYIFCYLFRDKKAKWGFSFKEGGGGKVYEIPF